MSAKFTPIAWTLIRTMPGRTSGFGTSDRAQDLRAAGLREHDRFHLYSSFVTRPAYGTIPLAVMFPRGVSSQRAGQVLRRVFGHIEGGLAFRLWDGTGVVLGGDTPVCTVVMHRPETFLRLVRNPSPLNFAEAYIESAIDIEGDLFAAMRIANAVEEIRISFADRMRILGTLWRG